MAKSKSETKATGQVSPTVQQGYNNANAGYQEGSTVAAARDYLNGVLNSKPKSFSSTYEGQLSSIYDRIMNRDQFNYNFNADAMYKQYAQNYQNQAKQAMNDTIGQVAALSGGYASSYAQIAGQQQYNNYLTEMSAALPEFYSMAYDRYKAEGDWLNNTFDAANTLYQNDYTKYRSEVSDWQADRSYAQGAYESERDFDYNKFSNDRSYYANEYWNEKNAEKTTTSTSKGSSGSSTKKKTNVKKSEVNRTKATTNPKNLDVFMSDLRMIQKLGQESIEDYMAEQIEQGKISKGDAAYILDRWYS